MAGNTIAGYDLPTNRNLQMRWDSLRATSDGGVIFALGFNDTYHSETESWASEAGVVSKVIKLDAEGKEQWSTELAGVAGVSLWSCIETEDGYCFFGEVETPETDRQGVYSPTDLSVIKLDRQGQHLLTRTYGGSDYDSFWRVEEVSGGFAVYVQSQSDDGLFAGCLPEGEKIASFRVLLDDQFEVTGIEQVSSNVHVSELEAGYTAYTVQEWIELQVMNAAGTMTLALDYGDFTLIVSENNIGVMEAPVHMSARFYETETVYSAWQDGRLLWRAAVE